MSREKQVTMINYDGSWEEMEELPAAGGGGHRAGGSPSQATDHCHSSHLSALPPACAGRSRDYIPLYRPGRALFASLQILFSPPGASPPSVLDGSWELESTLSFSVTMGRK